MSDRGNSILAAGLGMVSMLGCGSSGPELGRVEGIVTIQGKPAEGVVVNFDPEGGGRASTGLTDHDGRFVMRFTQDRDGAVIGSHTAYVRLSNRNTGNERTVLEERGLAVNSGKNEFAFEIPPEKVPRGKTW